MSNILQQNGTRYLPNNVQDDEYKRALCSPIQEIRVHEEPIYEKIINNTPITYNDLLILNDCTNPSKMDFTCMIDLNGIYLVMNLNATTTYKFVDSLMIRLYFLMKLKMANRPNPFISQLDAETIKKELEEFLKKNDIGINDYTLVPGDLEKLLDARKVVITSYRIKNMLTKHFSYVFTQENLLADYSSFSDAQNFQEAGRLLDYNDFDKLKGFGFFKFKNEEDLIQKPVITILKFEAARSFSFHREKKGKKDDE